MLVAKPKLGTFLKSNRISLKQFYYIYHIRKIRIYKINFRKEGKMKIVIRTCPLCGCDFDVDADNAYAAEHFLWCKKCFAEKEEERKERKF